MIPIRNLRRFFLKALHQPRYAFRVALRRSKAFFYYSFGLGKSSFPETITLFLTHACNLTCRMCGQWGDRGATKKQGSGYIHEMLSFTKLASIIDDTAKFHPNFTLFGGEPLLHPDALKLIAHIKQKGLHCLMITNGSLVEPVAKKLVESGLDELNVSLDGDSMLHDQIRGIQGVHERIMRGLQLVHEFKKKLEKRKPLVNLQCTVSSYNYLYLERLLKVAASAHADSLTFHHLIFIGPQLIAQQKQYDALLNCSSKNWEGFAFDPGINPQLLYEKIQQVRKAKHPFAVDFYPNFTYKALMEYYMNPEYSPKDYPCRCISPWVVCYIFPDGELRPCLNLDYSFGNVIRQDFYEVWNGEKAMAFRKALKKDRLFPACMRCTELYRY